MTDSRTPAMILYVVLLSLAGLIVLALLGRDVPTVLTLILASGSGALFGVTVPAPPSVGR